MRRIQHLVATAVVLTAAIAAARAQEQDNGSQHGVARISVIAGDVSIQRGDSGERSAAAVNAPVVADDVVATGQGSRAEIQFDYANMLRLSADSEVRLSEVSPKRYQLQVGRGTLMFSVVRDSNAQVEISTPSVSVRPLQRGAYRVSVFEDGRSEITVRAGEAEIYGPRGTENLRAGNTMIVRGDPSDPEFQVVTGIQQDDFDRWNADRDQNLMRSRSYEHVSPDVDGAEDLDSNGRWVTVPEYGTVWSPTVGPDWAPYRYGRWVWEDWYGWTWVSYDPWGWAPFHYGRWFWGGGPYGWCWYPGPIYGPHYWSPALVAFFGFGGFHVGVGFGGPGFGWVPLAPFEVFHPWWGRGFYGGYRNHNVLINNINVVNNVNIVNNYRNARIGNGVTAVNANDFAHGRFTTPIHVGPNQLQQASLVKGQVPIAPTAGSLRVSDRPTTVAPRSNLNNTRFFSHNQPAPVNRVPFAQQQQSLTQISRPGAASAANVARPQALPGGRAAGPTTGSANAVQSGGWRPVTPATRGAATPNSPVAANSGGWRRFGDSPRAGAASQAPRTVQPAYQPRGGNESSTSGWRRFGAPNQATPGGSPNAWRTPGDRPATAAPSTFGRFQGSPSDGWRRYQPGTQPATPRYSSPSYGSPRSLQIAPPIVRERSAPSYQPHSGGSGGGNGGGSRQSAPSGGGGHSSGGGGGHSSGGSGGHSRR